MNAEQPCRRYSGVTWHAKKWTRGGTARREQERAESKARRRADRLARWQKEKEARIQSRVHKPKLDLQLQEGVTEP